MKVKNRALAILLSMVMALTFMPAIAFAGAQEESADPSDALELQQKDADTVESTGDDAGAVSAEDNDINTETLETPQARTLNATASGMSGSCGENLTWTLSEDGTLTISGTGEMDVAEDYFYDCADEEGIEINKVILEEGATTISEYAFTCCWDITEVHIPSTLVSIGKSAFEDCEVADIYYPGSYEDWSKIVIEYGNDELDYSNLHLYYGTDKQDDLVIIYKLRGGTIDGTPTCVVKEVGECTEDYELPTPIRTGYTFDGWYNDDYDEFTEIEAGTTGTIVLWAEWNENDYDETVLTTAALRDIPTAVNGETYSADPIKFYTEGDSSFEVNYYGQEIFDDYNGPCEALAEGKYGLDFGKDGTISGIVDVDEYKYLELTAAVTEKDGDDIIGYYEYTMWLNIWTDPEKYEIPDDVAEIDLSNVYGSDWYAQINGSADDCEYNIPYYKYTVAKGEEKWVKLQVASEFLILESSSWWTVPVRVVGADGFERDDISGEPGLAEFVTNPGETYYIYVNNTDGSGDESIYINDCGDYEYANGNLGDWTYKKTQSNVVNPYVEGSGKDWDVYTVGNLDNVYKWTIKGFNTSLYYYLSLDILSRKPLPVYYSEPKFEANFGTNQSVYKSKYRTSKDNKRLATGEQHNKINYQIRITDIEYVKNRQSKCTIDVYVPAGTKLTKDKYGYLHAALAKTSVKLTKAKKAFTAKWSKKAGVTGYQIQYGLKSNFSGAKKVTISNAKTTSKKISKLKSNKTYYVRIRTYKKVGKNTYYSAWSAKKSIKTK